MNLGAVNSTEKTIQEKESFLSNVLVSVMNALGSTDIIESLKNQGYNVELYKKKPNSRKDEESLPTIKDCQEGIWIGERVAPKVAINAIKTALKIWPDLKYIHIPSDKGGPPDYVNDQIFIGGASSTPLERGTKPWTFEELTSLDPNISTKEFHAKIRKKYS